MGENDVAHFVQPNVSQGVNPSFRRRPIVLAELPHVGSEAIDRIAPTSASDQPVERSPLSTNHFVDRPATKQPAATQPPPPTRSVSASQTHAGRSASATSTLFQLRMQIAPYAGFIVALALTASAGLLYWIIARPPATSLDYQDVHQPIDFHQGHSEADPLEWSSVESEPAWTDRVATPPSALSAEWSLEPITLPITFDNAQIALPEAPFPSTNTPSALDFSILNSRMISPSPSDALAPLPEIAVRTVPQPAVPTVRR